MKGYSLNSNFKEKILNELNSEYGLNFDNIYTDEDNSKYELFFNTKKNFHNKINKRKKS